jgi:hypothetical protein
LYARQEAAIYDAARIVNIEASTKSGKTVGCMAWLTEHAWEGLRAANWWWIAPYYGQAKIAYRRIKNGLPPQVFRYNDSELWIRLLCNHATMWFKSAEKPDALYGEDVHGAVIDEATRCREEAWHAVRSTLTATRGPVRIIGNVKGRKNWAYRQARKAEAGEPGMAYHKITAYDAVEAGVLDAEEIESARRDLPEDVFRELYLAEPTDDGANPFGLAAIANCVTSGLAQGQPVVWGWDLARKQDWTVGVGLDDMKRVCAFTRFQRPWPETVSTILDTTGDGFALVDSTGVGDPVLQELQRKSPRPNYEGYQFTEKSKQALMEGLVLDVQRGDVYFPDNELRVEMENFEYEYTRRGVRYSAPEGLHDDCVCALALARHAVENCNWKPVDLW